MQAPTPWDEELCLATATLLNRCGNAVLLQVCAYGVLHATWDLAHNLLVMVMAVLPLPGFPPHTPHYPGPCLNHGLRPDERLTQPLLPLTRNKLAFSETQCRSSKALPIVFNRYLSFMQSFPSDPRFEGMQTLLVQLLQQLQSSRITGDETLQRLLLHGCCKCLHCLGLHPDATDDRVSSHFTYGSLMLLRWVGLPALVFWMCSYDNFTSTSFAAS